MVDFLFGKDMNKAKEYAEKFVLTVDHQGDVEEAYNDGYHQAEKDLELSWEDIEAIDQIFTDVFKDGFDVITDSYYQEVLKRYKDFKERKEK